jgi:hypothetical protein
MAHSNFQEFERIHRKQRIELDEMDSKSRSKLYGARKWNQMRRKAMRIESAEIKSAAMNIVKS